MSSIYYPIFKGQKTVFFHRFLTHFPSPNHYMLWSNPIISPPNHNTSSELYSQRGLRGQEVCQMGFLVIFTSNLLVRTYPLTFVGTRKHINILPTKCVQAFLLISLLLQPVKSLSHILFLYPQFLLE